MKFFMKRSVINPILAITGSLTVISGLFLLFHYESHFIKAVHELSALILMIFGILHVVLNWKPLKNTLKGKVLVWAALIAACTIIMVVTGEKIDVDLLELRYLDYMGK